MKYFILSDIHSFYQEMITSLKLAHYDKNNKEHFLIVCGDLFDRGPDALLVYKFLKSIPKSRKALIRGNHEKLYLELLNKRFPEAHDFHNRTVDTFCQIAQMPEDLLNEDTYNYDEEVYLKGSRSSWEDIKNAVREHPITKWLQSNEWKDYYELDRFIFVHSFIPTKLKDSYLEENKELGIYAYATNDPKNYEYDHDWRASKYWDEAVWGCPWLQYKLELFQEEENKGKTLVCGHWHTDDFFKHLKNNSNHAGEIYYSKGIIAIDGGVFYNRVFEEYIHPQNILVIDENFKCYNEYGDELAEIKETPIIKTVTIMPDGTKIDESEDFINNK